MLPLNGLLVVLIVLVLADVNISFLIKFSRSLSGCSRQRPRFSVVADISKLYSTSPEFTFVASARLDLSKQMKVSDFLETYGQDSMEGVFIVSDSKNEVQYVSVADIPVQDELKYCLTRQGSEKVSFVRVQTFSVSNKMAIEAYRSELLNQLGYTPPGNEEANSWYKGSGEATTPETKSAAPYIAAASTSNPESSTLQSSLRESIGKERQIYSEKAPVQMPGAEDEVAIIESPFKNSVVNPDQSTVLELNIANVDKVLDEVRPYLIADGGNVEVVDVEEKTRNVILKLKGACGSCPSSTTTMKMGIERVLRENFMNLGEVISAPSAETNNELSISKVEEAIQKVLPAIKSLGGIVKIQRVDNNSKTVYLSYKGPAKLIQGLTIIIKEIPDVQAVEIDQSA